MPTYQYRCAACGHDLEATQKFSDPALTECPNCGGQLRKVFNAVGVVFKGSGFYRTDSRVGAKNGAGSDSADTGGSGKKETADSKSVEKEPAAAGSSANGKSSSSTEVKAAS